MVMAQVSDNDSKNLVWETALQFLCNGSGRICEFHADCENRTSTEVQPRSKEKLYYTWVVPKPRDVLIGDHYQVAVQLQEPEALASITSINIR